MKTLPLLLVVAIAGCDKSQPLQPMAASSGSALPLNRTGSAVSLDNTLGIHLPLQQMESGHQLLLSLALGPGRQIAATQRHLDREGPGTFSWTGTTGHGIVVITVHHGNVIGTIVDGNQVYRLSRLGGQVRIEPVKHHVRPKLGQPFLHRATQPPVMTADLPIEVIVAYTPAAKAHCADDMETLALHGVAVTNEVAEDTGVDARFHLAYAYPTEFSEASLPMDAIVDRFQKKGDHVMDEVHAYRTTYKADIAVLFAYPDDTDYVGMSAETTADAATAFSVVNCMMVRDDFTMTHEIGHLLGLNDDKDPIPTFKDGYGYAHDSADPAHSWRTVMSGGMTESKQLCEHECPPIPYWSNPSVDYLGDKTGVPGKSDDADVIRKTVGWVSHFMDGHPSSVALP